VVTVEEIRELARTLPRSDERVVGDRLKFRVGRLVYLSISPDETLMGFAYPKEQRDGLIASDPVKFVMPIRSDERYNWVRVRLAEIDRTEMAELVVEAWRMVVPRRVAVTHLGE
jgi:hypothetical protein